MPCLIHKVAIRALDSTLFMIKIVRNLVPLLCFYLENFDHLFCLRNKYLTKVDLKLDPVVRNFSYVTDMSSKVFEMSDTGQARPTCYMDAYHVIYRIYRI
jgi:hypothetical protein